MTLTPVVEYEEITHRGKRYNTATGFHIKYL